MTGRIIAAAIALVLGAPSAAAQSAGTTGSTESLSGQPVPLVGEPMPLFGTVASLYGDIDGLTVVQTPEFTEVRTAADILFPFDSAELTPESAALIEELAALLVEAAPAEVAVVGHTDGIGSDEYNDQLSLARAESVIAALQAREDLAGTSFVAEGRGAREPVAEEVDEDGEDIPEGRARNRRVELRFDV